MHFIRNFHFAHIPPERKGVSASFIHADGTGVRAVLELHRIPVDPRAVLLPVQSRVLLADQFAVHLTIAEASSAEITGWMLFICSNTFNTPCYLLPWPRLTWAVTLISSHMSCYIDLVSYELLPWSHHMRCYIDLFSYELLPWSHLIWAVTLISSHMSCYIDPVWYELLPCPRDHLIWIVTLIQQWTYPPIHPSTCQSLHLSNY